MTNHEVQHALVDELAQISSVRSCMKRYDPLQCRLLLLTRQMKQISVAGAQHPASAQLTACPHVCTLNALVR
jgi:hypothetical protein